MTFSDQLDQYIRSRATLIHLITREEPRALGEIKRYCENNKRIAISWDVADGFAWITASNATLVTAVDPITALETIETVRKEEHTIFILRDFHELWGNAQVKRKLRSVAEKLKQTRSSMVIISPAAQVPDELQNSLVSLELELPTFADIEAVLNHLLETPGVSSELSPLGKEKMIQAALGLTADQAQRVFARAIIRDGKLTHKDIELVTAEKKQIIRESEALEFYSALETAENIGGLDNLKNWLKLREKAFSNEAKSYGLPSPKGIALIGIPGTGKSLTAKMIAGLWQLPLLRLDMGALFGSLVGESEERTRRAIKLAETIAPCILWIDEMEKGLSQDGGDSGTSSRVFGSILTWMQEKTAPVFMVATANDISRIPAELMRKGRFDEIFFLDLPTLEERKEIVTVHLNKRNRLPVEYDIQTLAEASEGYVGSEIEQAIIDAMYIGFNDGMRNITTEDILKSIKTQVPLSISQKETIHYLRSWLHEGRALSASYPEKEIAETMSVKLNP
jgi:ATP-dependent 26S proteasome regulatory subunit